MSLQTRLAALVQAVGADIKSLKTADAAVGVFVARSNVAVGPTGAGNYQVTLPVKTDDPNNWFSTATGRYNPKKTGYYMLFGHVHCSTGMVNGRLMCGVSKNGGAPRYGVGIYGGSGGDDHRVDCSRILYANGTTDYFTLIWNHNSTSSMTISGECEFYGYYIGPEPEISAGV